MLWIDLCTYFIDAHENSFLCKKMLEVYDRSKPALILCFPSILLSYSMEGSTPNTSRWILFWKYALYTTQNGHYSVEYTHMVDLDQFMSLVTIYWRYQKNSMAIETKKVDLSNELLAYVPGSHFTPLLPIRANFKRSAWEQHSMNGGRSDAVTSVCNSK